METDDRGLLDVWRARQADLVDFDVFPVIERGVRALSGFGVSECRGCGGVSLVFLAG
jgi:hypothetical protein